MNEDILVEYVFTMIDKEGINVITFDQMKKFLTSTGIVLSNNEIKMLFDNLDINKTGKITIKDFKKNFTAELKTFSMARINMEADEDENNSNNQLKDKLDNIKDISFDKQLSVDSDSNQNGFTTIQFSCIKEPRHEFFSSLKRKQRLMVFGIKKMLYYDDNMN